jgi:hypothetical protein
VSGTATLVDAAMATWAPDTRHYLTSDGQHLAIHVHDGLNAVTVGLINETLEATGLATLEEGVNTIIVTPTTVTRAPRTPRPSSGWVTR